ncbi:Probable RNA 3'-terminal phosphate cyclase-like protein [Prunus dulcis]|uniref:Probable RNA 3'-terminal phosphate cyclase-like protein n=1 Tax=Prunus dulcis TaxID=3755 RepID=A0A4Y1RLQ6_PRUDU|nr:Probable RNA 3'-terminal phosphate cyclase-like protein [Prunus dulcis]
MVSLLPSGFVGFVVSSLCIMSPRCFKSSVGKLSPYGIDTLKNINDFLGVKFVIMPCASTSTVFLKCVGCGLRKLSRKISRCLRRQSARFRSQTENLCEIEDVKFPVSRTPDECIIVVPLH